MKIEWTQVSTPLGMLSIAATPAGACRIAFDEVAAAAMRHALRKRFPELILAEAEDPAGAASRLKAYFGGELGALDEVPVDPGGTPFQTAVWLALRDIPAGRTLSYGQLAARIGRPRAVRAVGAANGANPVGLVLPCHRVIGNDGRLTGYGGGLPRKAWLLRHERAPFVDLPAGERQLALPLPPTPASHADLE